VVLSRQATTADRQAGTDVKKARTGFTRVSPLDPMEGDCFRAHSESSWIRASGHPRRFDTGQSGLGSFFGQLSGGLEAGGADAEPGRYSCWTRQGLNFGGL
jgi:hypothetical protein